MHLNKKTLVKFLSLSSVVSCKLAGLIDALNSYGDGSILLVCQLSQFFLEFEYLFCM